jgi:hypothetical protein
VKPVISNTEFTQRVRELMQMVSSGWKDLTDAGRAAWVAWAQTNPIVDKLGDRQVLAGNAAFVKLGTVKYACSGVMPTLPPVTGMPLGLGLLTGTFDIGAGGDGIQLSFTPSPMEAGTQLYVSAAVVDGGARAYVKNLFKLVHWTGTPAYSGGTYIPGPDASPIDLQPDIELRFGTLIAGQTVHLNVAVVDKTTGLISVPRPLVGEVVSTP